jgi:hypothetical protein
MVLSGTVDLNRVKALGYYSFMQQGCMKMYNATR